MRGTGHLVLFIQLSGWYVYTHRTPRGSWVTLPCARSHSALFCACRDPVDPIHPSGVYFIFLFAIFHSFRVAQICMPQAFMTCSGCLLFAWPENFLLFVLFCAIDLAFTQGEKKGTSRVYECEKTTQEPSRPAPCHQPPSPSPQETSHPWTSGWDATFQTLHICQTSSVNSADGASALHSRTESK